jgi:xylene monooxygenase subunit XylM
MPRLRHWDEQFATPGELVLAVEANCAAGWPVWQRAGTENRVS